MLVCVYVVLPISSLVLHLKVHVTMLSTLMYTQRPKCTTSDYKYAASYAVVYYLAIICKTWDKENFTQY